MSNKLFEYTRCIQKRMPKSVILKKIIIRDLQPNNAWGLFIYNFRKEGQPWSHVSSRVQISLDPRLIERGEYAFMRVLLHEVGHLYLKAIFFRNTKSFLDSDTEEFIVDSAASTVTGNRRFLIHSQSYTTPLPFLGEKNPKNEKYRVLAMQLTRELKQVYSDIKDIGYCPKEMTKNITHDYKE